MTKVIRLHAFNKNAHTRLQLAHSKANLKEIKISTTPLEYFHSGDCKSDFKGLPAAFFQFYSGESICHGAELHIRLTYSSDLARLSDNQDINFRNFLKG